MYPLELPIFNKSDKFSLRLTSSRLIFGGYIILLLFSFYQMIFPSFQIPHNIFMWLFKAIGIFIVIGYLWAMYEKENQNGKIEGEIIFYEDKITIAEVAFLWKEIKIKELASLRFLGEKMNSSSLLGPRFLQGVNNFIAFDMKGESKKVFFQFKSKDDKILFDEMIKDQFRKGNIDLRTTYNGLHLDYDEIQELKKSMIK